MPVVLRPFRPDELEAYRAAMPPERRTRRDVLARRLAASGRIGRDGFLRLAIEADGRLVGDCQARSIPRAMPPGVFEIGITLWDEADRGRGLGRAAVAALTALLFAELGAQRVQASTAVANVPMRSVLERLGFAEEGVMRSFMPAEGGRDDYVLYAVTRPGWTGGAG